LEQSASSLLLLFPFFPALHPVVFPKKETFGVIFGVNDCVILMPIFHAIIHRTKHEKQKRTNTKEKLC
jgi:hypothetical protein